MKIILCICVSLLLLFSFPVSAQWNVINRDITIRKIIFTNDSTSYIVSNRNIYKTTNSGKQWNNVLTTTEDILNSISFPNDSIGYVGSANEDWNRIYKTTDGGLTWNKFTLPTHLGYVPRLQDVCFINSDTGFVCCVSEFFKTIDGGVTWTKSIVFERLMNLFKLNDSTVYGTGGSVVRQTNDFGKTWHEKYISGYDDNDIGITSCFFINQSIGFLVGCDFKANYFSTVLKTIDGGITWEHQIFSNCRGFTTSFWSVYFTSDSIGYVCGDCGIIMKTTDQGNTWNIFQFNEQPLSFMSMYFTNSNTGYAGGGDFLLKTINAGGNSFQPFELIGKNYLIYPNPFHEKFNIEINGYLLDELSLKLVIDDFLGNNVYYHNLATSASNIIDCNYLSNGIYYYRIIDTNHSIVGKGKIIKN